MPEERATMKIPELLVFARVFAVGLIAAEVARLSYYTGRQFAPLVSEMDWCPRVTTIAACVFICAVVCGTYAFMRDARETVMQLGRSRRVDLAILLLLGIWSNFLIAPSLQKMHGLVVGAAPGWAPTILSALVLVLTSSLWRDYLSRRAVSKTQLYFLTDEEVKIKEDDVLKVKDQAEQFADVVLASGSRSGLVFGIEGPWGVGKSSFINFAEKRWTENGSDSVIVFRFEPLRYATDPDLAERFIRDLSTRIQRETYAPEFGPAVNRYTRLLKGKADFSFLGFKLSLEPSNETIDELLEDIDDVLKRIHRRVIVVIDDLDRLDAKTVYNILYTVRRTFKLTQATYILCYDTENLVGSKEDSDKVREFLEKFVNAKLSLFVDSSTLRNFLTRDWRRDESQFPSIPSDTMSKFSSVLSTLADFVDGEHAFLYGPLVGDLRKLKRFVNALLLIQIEKTDLGKTDFNNSDLINLILLHLHYPGIFRRIYTEETEQRSGIFSTRKERDSAVVRVFNADGFQDFVAGCNSKTAAFLLRQLFDADVLGEELLRTESESELSSRACFNSAQYRNLEKYLKLIVRLATPEPRETFKLYQDAVDDVILNRVAISTVLEEGKFRITDSELAHDQFWRVLVSKSYDLSDVVANDAINSLVRYMPRYTSIDSDDRGLRHRSIYDLIRLLDRAGWGRTSSKRLANTPNNVVEIAHRIFGDGKYSDQGLIHRLAAKDRGALGWYDLMLFRLQCSADRQGQIYNVHSALLLREDIGAKTTGLVSILAKDGMRTLSQQVFNYFRAVYIDSSRNYFSEVDETSDDDFLGDIGGWLKEKSSQTVDGSQKLSDRLLAARSHVKGFVIYQLANQSQPTGAGVGCGVYDETGNKDQSGIARLMSKYVFDFCFNPMVAKDNVFHFADYCLSNLHHGALAGREDEGYVASESGLSSGFDRQELKKYWAQFGPHIRERNLPSVNRRVVTSSYIATYKDELPKIFGVLDNL